MDLLQQIADLGYRFILCPFIQRIVYQLPILDPGRMGETAGIFRKIRPIQQLSGNIVKLAVTADSEDIMSVLGLVHTGGTPLPILIAESFRRFSGVKAVHIFHHQRADKTIH